MSRITIRGFVMPKRQELKPHRTMRVVRSWLPKQGIFQYFTLYSDGSFHKANRREADQYAKAYGEKVKTIYGEPEESTWAMTAPSTTGK